MQTQQLQTEQPAPILQIAWTKFGQLDAYSKRRTKAHLRFRRSIAVLGILATLFAILTTIFPTDQPTLLSVGLKTLLVLTPLLASGLAAFGSKLIENGDWLIARAGAEEIQKEIYNYRTVLQNTPQRNVWLEQRLVEIQRSVFRGMNGELIMSAYQGPIPPNYSSQDLNSDPGFHDLSGDEYFKYRTDAQLAWHTRKVNQRQVERVRLQFFIIFSGVAGALLAVFLPIWTALAASFTAVLIGWQELRNLDSVIRNYSKVIIELNIISDHWKNLGETEKISTEFFKTVRSTEDILWSQNVEYIKAMQEALKESDLEEEANLINRVIREQRESDARFKRSIEDAVVDYTTDGLNEAQESLTETYETALGTLAEEASSDLVQAELASMQQGMMERFHNFQDSLDAIAEEFSGVDIGRDTPKSVLNDYLSRFPKSQDAVG